MAGVVAAGPRPGTADHGTGFATRAVSGTPPAVPPPGTLDAAVDAVVEAMAGEAHMVSPRGDGAYVLDKEGA